GPGARAYPARAARRSGRPRRRSHRFLRRQLPLAAGDEAEGLAQVAPSQRVELGRIDEVGRLLPRLQLPDLVVHTQLHEQLERLGECGRIVLTERARCGRRVQTLDRPGGTRSGDQSEVAGEIGDREKAPALDVEPAPVLAGV